MYEIKNLKFNNLRKDNIKFKAIENRIKENHYIVINIEREVIELFDKLDRLPKSLVIYNYYFSLLEVKNRIKTLKFKYNEFKSQQNKSCKEILEELQYWNNSLICIFESLNKDIYFKTLFHTSKWLFD